MCGVIKDRMFVCLLPTVSSLQQINLTLTRGFVTYVSYFAFYLLVNKHSFGANSLSSTLEEVGMVSTLMNEGGRYKINAFRATKFHLR